MAAIMTPKFRVFYPNVFKAKKNDLSGKDEFSLMTVFPKGADLSALHKAAEEALIEKFGPDKKKWPKNLKNPFRKHEEKLIEDEATGRKILPPGMEEGGIFLTLKSQQKPGLVDPKNQDILTESEFYAGCWARATVAAYAYLQKGNAGVAFGLRNLQKMAEGDLLGSRTKAQDDFAPIEDPAASGEANDGSSIFS